jgi:ABC-type multidrug transport system ATPase subunit
MTYIRGMEQSYMSVDWIPAITPISKMPLIMQMTIETFKLTRKFNGITAVDNISFRVRKGSIFGFLGLNGAGKTTTLKILTTIIPPTSGTAIVDGYDVTKEPVNVRRIIGTVSEESGTICPSWNPIEYFSYFGRLHGMSKTEIKGRRKELLDLMDLSKYKNKPMGTFSEGMKKKVEICRAMLHEPKILFLDEPTKELDIPSKREMWNLLKELVKAKNITVFLCSHDILEIDAMCDDVCVIYKGNITFSGNVNKLKESNILKIKVKYDQRLLEYLERCEPMIKVLEVEDDCIYCKIDKPERKAEILQIINKAGYRVDEFVIESKFEEKLTKLLRGEI